MAFTSKNDINIIQASDNAKIGAGAGNDVYVLGNPELVGLAATQKIEISDTAGVNTLRLIDGLTITTAMASATTLRLTLSNGAQITVLGANNFSFGVGGDAFGRGETVQDFASFATDTLGMPALPAPGAAAISVNNIEIGSTNIVTIDVDSQATFTGTAAEEIFSFDAAAALAATGTVSQATIALFDAAGDTLRFNLPTATGASTLADLNGEQGVTVQYNDLDNYTLINFGNDADGEVVSIQLQGVNQAAWAAVNVSIV